MRDDGKDNKKDRKRPKLNKEQKLKKQVEELQEQAQIDLEGYVTCRSALRAVRQELVDEEKKLERVKADYHEMKERHAPLKYLSAEYRRVRRIKRHVRDLTKAKKKLHRDMKEHRDGVRRKTVTNIFALVSFAAMIMMILWRLRQLSYGVYYQAMYAAGQPWKAHSVHLPIWYVQTAFESGVYRVWIVRYMAVDTGMVYEEKGLAWHIEAIC